MLCAPERLPSRNVSKYVSFLASSLCSTIEEMCGITALKLGFAELWAHSTSVIDFFSPQSEATSLNHKGSACQMVSLHTQTVTFGNAGLVFLR